MFRTTSDVVVKELLGFAATTGTNVRARPMATLLPRCKMWTPIRYTPSVGASSRADTLTFSLKSTEAWGARKGSAAVKRS